MYAMQFDVAYDKEKVDFANATSVDNSKYIVSAKDNNGTITVVVATKGVAIENDKDIVNLEFTAKAAGENIAFNITYGEISDEEGKIIDMADEATTVTIIEGTVDPEPEVDKTALKIAIDYADEIVANGGLEGVVPAVVKEFNESLAQAKEVYGNDDVTEVEVDAAFKRLVNSIWMLEFKQGNKEALQVLADSVKALVEKEYTSDSWANLQRALGEAEKVIADENAMQEEVDEALNNLKTAIDALVKKNINKTALQSLVNKVEGLNKDKYIKSTWDKFEKALKDAEKVLANEDATQEEVDAAYNNLLKSYL
ncbi:cohesin domain-containing protein, partial [Clostridium perfringens]